MTWIVVSIGMSLTCYAAGLCFGAKRWRIVAEKWQDDYVTLQCRYDNLESTYRQIEQAVGQRKAGGEG